MADISLQYLDQPLNNVSVGYVNDDYFAEKLFAPVPVKQRSGRFWVFGKEKFHRYETVREPKAESREIAPWSLSNSPYFCNDHSLKDSISDEERAGSDDTDLEINTVQNLTDAILLDLEIRVMNLLIGPGSPVPGATLAGTSQWSDYVNSDPIAAVEAQKTVIKKSIAKTPNTLAVSYPVYAVLRQHPKIIDRFKYTQVGILQADHLKSVFDVDNFWVLGAEYDTAGEGQTPALDFIWGKHAMLAYVPASAQRLQPALGYTFRWLFGAPDLGGTLTKRYRVESKASDVIEVHRYDDVQLVAPQAGFMFLNAVA
ncbi:MAG TPA: hypothetical protein VFZ08_04905 [Terriglobia bacterium]|nr:hypothetical protein [Terriglobia bacterium]